MILLSFFVVENPFLGTSIQHTHLNSRQLFTTGGCASSRTPSRWPGSLSGLGPFHAELTCSGTAAGMPGRSAATVLLSLLAVAPPARHSVGAQLLDLLHLGEDCWDSCGQQQGPCAWCGAGTCTADMPGSDTRVCSGGPAHSEVCDSPLNDAASYQSEAAMSAAGWSFDFDVEADHGFHAVYVRGAGPINVALSSSDYCAAPDPAGHGSLMSGWKWSDQEGELAATVRCGNCDSGVATIEFSNCNTGHVQVRLNHAEVARAQPHEIKTASVPFRNGDVIGVHDAGGNAVHSHTFINCNSGCMSTFLVETQGGCLTRLLFRST